ncbi:MAG: response regulator [Lachnospiraceae bacterium]|nr:response regulator [Lachnospiraceae bacterium]
MSDFYFYILSIKGQIGCMCILLYMAWTYFMVKRKNTRAHRLFSSMLIVSIIYMFFDMVTVYTINHVEDFSFSFNHFVHVIYMVAMCTDLFITYLYIRTLALNEQKLRYRDLIPMFIAAAGAIFLSFECVETPYGNYSWGSYAFVVFASAYLYFFVGMFLLFKGRKTVDAKAFRAICTAMVFQLATAIVQGIFPTLLISNIGVTIIVFSLYYSVESPDAILIEMLADERTKAENANRSKSMFLAQMSHDIRTPMNAVLGMNEMILREAKDDDILEYAGNIKDSGKTLLAIINSILDFSKIEDGKMELLSVEYDTKAMLNNLVISVADRARSKGLHLNVNIDETIPCKLRGDDVRVTQVIMNLLTNAVKYTEKGSVTFTVRSESIKDNTVSLYVSVEDTGIGIKEEDMDKLLTSFSRIEEERNRYVEGTGLGMTIVDRLLKMMNSSIQVESTYGKGSKFYFVLTQEIVDPAPMGDYKERSKDEKEDASGETKLYAPNAKILVVDDNKMNLKVAKHLLKAYGIVPDLAYSGPEAIEKIKETQYDFIGLDHMMPDMDGIETLQILKKENLLPESTVVVAMTANAVVGAKEQYLAAGFDDYITKPIEYEKLEEMLIHYLPKEKTQ